MSINKTSSLGKIPVELGIKDAVHVAIVSLRAGCPLRPGEEITINADGEAVRAHVESFGKADPWRKDVIQRGSAFWGVLNMDQVPSVQHHWDHPKFSFEAPKVEPKNNKHLQAHADSLKIPYESLIAACSKAVFDNKTTDYCGELTENEFEEAKDDIGHDLWYYWADEMLHEFSNQGTDCCPEYDYPDFPFVFAGEKA